MISLNDVIEFIHNPLAYEQNLVSIINNEGEQILLCCHNDLYKYPSSTIKIEGMERFNAEIYNRCNYYKLKYSHVGPITCHAFLAHQDSPSFGLHTDPDDVIIFCCDGTKTMMIDGKHTTINKGHDVYIPANTQHEALNEYPSLMLSFGLEKYLSDKAKYYELDVISKDNGNL